MSQPLEEGRFEALDPSSHAAALHAAVERYQADQSPATLNGAFAAAAVAVAASMLGTTLSLRVLEAMSDQQFRRWANHLITTVATYYIIYSGWLLIAKSSAEGMPQ